jgi:transposase
MIADALGNPLAFTLTGAEQADITQAQPLIEKIDPPGAVIADKGYDANAFVETIKAIPAQAVIPPRVHRCEQRPWDRHLYRGRHLIENLFARLKEFRRFATRYEKLASQFAAFVTVASICIWLK